MYTVDLVEFLKKCPTYIVLIMNDIAIQFVLLLHYPRRTLVNFLVLFSKKNTYCRTQRPSACRLWKYFRFVVICFLTGRLISNML